MRASGGANWEITGPHRISGVTDATVAGFRDLSASQTVVSVFPQVALTLIVELGDDPLVVQTMSGSQVHGSFVAGFRSDAVRVHGNNMECVQVKLSPVVARTVLGTSPGDLDGTVIALEDLWGPDAGRLREQATHARSWQDRFALVEAVLARRYESGPSVEPQVAQAWEHIVASRGDIGVGDLAIVLGWSPKRLWSTFRAQIGLAPKRMARLVRFEQAAHRLVAGEDIARIAAENGYVDQSHLNRDVRAFTGATPTTVASDAWSTGHEIAWAR